MGGRENTSQNKPRAGRKQGGNVKETRYRESVYTRNVVY